MLVQSAHYLATIHIFKLVCALRDKVRIGPVLDTTTTNVSRLHSVEILVPSKNNLHSCSGYSSVAV